MKPVTYGAALLGLVSAALGQAVTLAPSPTKSVGCEPHGDYRHCEGSVTASVAVSVSAAASGSSTVVPHLGDHHLGPDCPCRYVSTTRTALPSTAGAPRYEVAGLGFAGLTAVAAMAL